MKRLAIALAVVLLAGVGCTPVAPAEPSDSGRVMQQSAFPAGSWTMTSITRSGQKEEDVSDMGVALTLDAGGQLSAKICNSMSGSYTLTNGELTAGEVAATLMFCEGVLGEAEAAFTSDLNAGFRVEGSGNELMLRGDSGTAFAFERSIATAAPEDTGTQSKISGTVSALELDGVAVDGPAIVRVKLATGVIVDVNVPSFGLGLCPAKAEIADAFALKVGDAVEVNGTLTEDGAIVPCESPDHYLRVVAK